MTNKIDEKSWISLSLSLVLVGGAFWATLVYAQVGQNKSDIFRLDQKQTEYEHQVKEMNEKLATIQGMLMVKGAR